MPKPMTPEDMIRELRRLRFSPKAGRPFTFAWLARQAGYTRTAIHQAIVRGSMSPLMAKRLGPSLESANVFRADIAPTLGRPGGGTDGRGSRRASLSRRLGAGARARRERTSDD
jgi:hypothetical protein